MPSPQQCFSTAKCNIPAGNGQLPGSKSYLGFVTRNGTMEAAGPTGSAEDGAILVAQMVGFPFMSRLRLFHACTVLLCNMDGQNADALTWF